MNMELKLHQTPGNSSPYVTAPSTPQNSTDPSFYHSAPTSPCINNNNNATLIFVDSFKYKPYSISFRTHSTTLNFDDFEFQTSHIIHNNNKDGSAEYFQDSQHERVSFSSWASVDDPFGNDKSIPLKLPPRLQFPDKNMNKRGIRNQESEHPSKTSSLRKPSAKPIEFDPFMAALEKVMEEERGRRSNARMYDGNHRRARSHSPSRTSVSETQNDDHLKSNLNTLHGDLKGLKYARYVRSQTTPSISNVVVVEEEEEEEEDNATSSSTILTQSKMHKIKKILLKYARIGRSRRKKGKSENVINRKDRKMVIVKLKPALCSGYAMHSPPRSSLSIS